MILGSFSLYAAISRAEVFYEGVRRVAEITHIYVCARDGFTFNDSESKASQYLGHWNRQTLAIVPAQAALQVFADEEWIDGPVYQDPLRANFNVLYPVKNKDFRNWQIKHNRGGDFIIYTNRHPIRLQQPIKINLD